MTKDQARAWIKQLVSLVTEGKITKMDADEEVFEEMAHGDHDAETETFFYEFTRSNVVPLSDYESGALK